MQSFQNQVSIIFHSKLSSELSHTLLYENEEIFNRLMNSGFKTKRKGPNIAMYLNSDTDVYKARAITQSPLFIKF